MQYWQDLSTAQLHRLIIEHQPAKVAQNLASLGINVPKTTSSMTKALQPLAGQDYGQYVEQLAMVLDVPIEAGKKGYELLANYQTNSLGAIALTHALIHAPEEQELMSQSDKRHLQYWSSIGYYTLLLLTGLLILLFLMRQ